jgi:predicted RNA-binding Zn-ribbon protein involved in translation (DUF1610 family)
MSSPKIVTIDIETAPIEAFVWGLWDVTVGLNQIKTDWSILSYAAKWLDQKGALYQDTGGRGAGMVRNDMILLQGIWNILDEADIVVTQNGKAFDIKKINARMLGAGLKPYSPVKIIDTKLVAKKHFAFTSNKLEWMSAQMTEAKKSQHKKFPGFDLWLECLKDNAEAWAEMKKYNIQDVVSTEQLYLKLRPWIEGHANVGLYSELEAPQCPKCGSQEVQKRGLARTATGVYQRYQCNECGGWTRGRQAMNTPKKRQSLLVG